MPETQDTALGPGAAADLVRDRLRLAGPVSLALVTGSGLGLLAGLGGERGSIPYSEIPGMGRAGVGGHEGCWRLLELPGGDCLHCLSGRRHLYEGIEPWAAGFAMRILACLGVRRAILTNAAGGISPRAGVGDLMLIRDHLNLMGAHPAGGRAGGGSALPSPNWRAPYDAAMSDALLDAAREEGIELKEGVYAGLKGPSYETPAEAAMLRRLGADAVGMSTVPEVLEACAAGVRVAALSIITNSHLGPKAEASHEEVLRVARQSGERLKRLLGSFLRNHG